MAKPTKEQVALQKEANELQKQGIITAKELTAILKEINGNHKKNLSLIL